VTETGASRPADRYIRLTVGNYRCFPASRPLRFTFRPGFTSLIGPNNAGKSTLLKFLYEFRDLMARVPTELATTLRSSGAAAFNFPPEVTDTREVASRLEQGDIWARIEVSGYGKTADPAIRGTSLVLRILRGQNTYRSEAYLGDRRVEFSDSGIATPGDFRYQQGPLQVDLGEVASALSSLRNTIYIGPFRNAVNVGARSQYYDLDIGQAFITQWRQRQTGNDRAANEATERLSETIRTIFGFESLTIMPTPGDETLAVFINRVSRRLNEVGAGLAQFVVCLANAAVRQPDWILIDEPEMNLHPRLQSEFLRALGSFANEGVVFATHVLGLARSHTENVYSLRLIRDGETDVEPYAHTARLAEFLGELGYESLREIGFDRLLLVEGPSDLLAIKELLRKYGKEAKTVVFHLGGGDRATAMASAELAEVKQITDRVSVLIDSERNAEGEAIGRGRQALVDACRSTNIPILVLKRRALENYFPDRALKFVFGPGINALGPYDTMSIGSRWNKQENWRVASAMTRDDLIGTDLGNFLDDL